MEKVMEYYDKDYDEWERLGRHKVEFEITKRHLDEIIKKPNSKILDCGGGPGRYSIYLSQKGHEVTLLDLSKRNIEVAKNKNAELGGGIKRFIQGDALKLDEYQLEEYDYILLMGPLYHITDKDLQEKVLLECEKYLKDDGLIFATFISNYAPIIDYIKYLYPLKGEGFKLLNYLKEGINQEGFTTAYFSSSEEAIDLLDRCGYEKLRFVGIENVFIIKEAEAIELPEEEFASYLDLCYHLGYDEKLLGSSEHYLYIGKKKER